MEPEWGFAVQSVFNRCLAAEKAFRFRAPQPRLALKQHGKGRAATLLT
jgi:hypothetical protein